MHFLKLKILNETFETNVIKKSKFYFTSKQMSILETLPYKCFQVAKLEVNCKCHLIQQRNLYLGKENTILSPLTVIMVQFTYRYIEPKVSFHFTTSFKNNQCSRKTKKALLLLSSYQTF